MVSWFCCEYRTNCNEFKKTTANGTGKSIVFAIFINRCSFQDISKEIKLVKFLELDIRVTDDGSIVSLFSNAY